MLIAWHGSNSNSEFLPVRTGSSMLTSVRPIPIETTTLGSRGCSKSRFVHWTPRKPHIGLMKTRRCHEDQPSMEEVGDGSRCHRRIGALFFHITSILPRKKGRATPPNSTPCESWKICSLDHSFRHGTSSFVEKRVDRGTLGRG